MTARGASAQAAPPPDVLRIWVSPLVAEFIGTFALIFMGASAIIMTGGNNLVAIAFAHGLAIGLNIAAAGHISGGHFNPAVTVGLFIGRKIELPKAVAYIIIQLVGATVAALVIKAVFPSAAIDAVKFGTPGVGSGFKAGQAFVSEIVLTFFLMYVIYGVAVDKRGAGMIAPLAIGLTITMDIFANGAVGGAAMNPARHFGPALVGNVWSNGWIWYTAPFIGSAIAAIVFNYVYLPSADKT